MADQQRARARGRADRLDLRIDRPCADSGLRGHALQPADLARPRRQLHGRGSPASARAGVPQRTWRGAAEGLRRAVRRPQPAPGHDRVDGLWRSQREGLRDAGGARRRHQGHGVGPHPQPDGADRSSGGGARKARVCRTGQQRAPATVREDLYEPMDFRQLLASGAIGRLTIDNAQLEAGFAGGPGAALDPAALARPDETFIELYVAYLNPPTIGRALLGDEGYRHMRAFLEPGQHAWWVASAGRGSFLDPDFVRGTSPSRLGLGQDGAPHELRDFDLDPRAPPGAPALNASLVLRTAPLDTLDAASPQAFELFVTRSRGRSSPNTSRQASSSNTRRPRASSVVRRRPCRSGYRPGRLGVSSLRSSSWHCCCSAWCSRSRAGSRYRPRA